MPQKYFIVPAGSEGSGEGGGAEIDNSLPGNPVYPSHGLPPLPGIWPPPGKPNFPVDPGYGHPGFGQGHPSNPIYIDGSPENPIVLPPGTIWPPLPEGPSNGLPVGPDLKPKKVAILVLVLGYGWRWFIYDPTVNPPVPQPK